MKRIFIVLMMFVTFSAFADERGEKRLEMITKHYASIGHYSVEFVLRAEGATQRGKLVVSGADSYMRVGDTEVYVLGALRYEVKNSSKEIILDNADLYEKELLNPMNGFTKVRADYNIEERNVDGATVVCLSPKKSGETIYIITGADGVSIAKVKYISGDSKAEMSIERLQKGGEAVPSFSKDRYKGYELIDFR